MWGGAPAPGAVDGELVDGSSGRCESRSGLTRPLPAGARMSGGPDDIPY